MAKRILVVDDEPDIRMMLSKLLEAKGFETDQADNGESALTMLTASDYDLMILDLIMPVVNGHEVLHRINPELREKMPVVVLTAKDKDADMMQGYIDGATCYMTKPFSNQGILDVVNYFIGDLTPEERIALERRI